MRLHRSIGVFGFIVVAGCAAQVRQAPDVGTTELTNATVPRWPDLGTGPDRTITIQLGPDSLEHCRRVSPKFKFNSAVLEVEERPGLDAFASCMNHPSMQGRMVVLVGRADPRGGDQYNEALGMKRALQIKQALVDSGIDPTRIRVESRGAEGAVGQAQGYSYGYDRRVDVIVPGVHAPQ